MGEPAEFCWDLDERRSYLGRTDGRAWSRDDPHDCRLTSSSDDWFRFSCGDLRLGARQGLARADLLDLERLTRGTLTDLGLYFSLDVPAGAERSALRLILYDPRLTWVNFAITGPAWCSCDP